MAREGGQSAPRPRRLTRRTLLQREGAAPSAVARLLSSPNAGWGVLIVLVFVVLGAVLASWARQQPLVAVGRVMTDTRLVRVSFTVQDHERTRELRERRRQQTPRVYRASETVLATIFNSIENLPRALASVESVDQLAPELARQFTIPESALGAIKAEAQDGVVGPGWAEKARRFLELLAMVPMVDGETWQNELQTGLNTQVELRIEGREPAYVSRNNLVDIRDGESLRDAARSIARSAGFAEPVLSVVASRLTNEPQPTYQFDETLTTERQNQNADAVPPEVRTTPIGQVIYKRGDVLNQSQYDQYREELRQYQAEGERWRIWIRRAGVSGAVAIVALAGAAYLGLFCRRVARNPGRSAGVAALGLGALALACAGTVANPSLVWMTAVTPTVLMAAIIVVAYDRRVALALGALHAVLVCLALDLPIGFYAVAIAGIGIIVWQLHEIRDRRTVVRAGLVAGAGMGTVTMLVALIDRPLMPASAEDTMIQAAFDALWSAAGGVLTGAVVLTLLPSIEKWFDITTGLTLIEKRDPKQPLLRQLQQRAPGTYNHSLNVASIAEAASESVGADGLLTYVGALYHDIGKMNKPDYFVENHSGGPSKHDRLSPAMSLLVIVGHVKDGMALAEEYGLPRSLRHFIEAHHGTTLVEFFYSRARQQAESRQDEGEETETPAEIEYRYPGPRPRTKEVGIVMIADAVESATRTMAEPTPSRIDALVRAIANKRLMDGQFDECDLTLRDLQTISESISKSMASIYHGRVQYPSTAAISEARAEEKRA